MLAVFTSADISVKNESTRVCVWCFAMWVVKGRLRSRVCIRIDKPEQLLGKKQLSYSGLSLIFSFLFLFTHFISTYLYIN